MNPAMKDGDELRVYLHALARYAQPGQSFDVRWLARDGVMVKSHIYSAYLDNTERFIRLLSTFTDVYVGVALRNGIRHGGKDSIDGSHLAYVEIDHPNAADALRAFSPVPSMVVSSGSAGHLHAYWSLYQLLPGDTIEHLNRRLAIRLGGDPASVDIARILRPPETTNRKRSVISDVRLIHYDATAIHTFDSLDASLPAEPASVIRPAKGLAQGPSRTVPDQRLEELLAVPSPVYAKALADAEANRAGKILCPFHSEETPSLQLYSDGSFYCFGRDCKRGGTVIDFGAYLSGIAPRRSSFITLRDRLWDQLCRGGRVRQ